MVKIQRILLVVAALCLLSSDSFAQDPTFTQFYASPVYLNPAFAGTMRCPRLVMNYRNEWPGIADTEGKTYITYAASYDQHIDALAGGVGLIVTNDRAGIGRLTTTSASLIYSYQLPVSRTFSIKAGAQASFMQKKIDWSQLRFGDQIDPRRGFVFNTQETPIENSVKFADFSAGVLGFSRTYFVGLAVHHLTEPNDGLTDFSDPSYGLPMKITGHAGAVFPLDGRGGTSTISPNVLIQKQGDFKQVNLGMYFTRGVLVGGMWYRSEDAVIILLGLQQDMFKFGYSYDVTVSKLTEMATYGSHEISFGLQFDCKPKKKKFRTISCPSF